MITSWSYSTWKTYKQCPLRIKLRKLDHLPDAPSQAMERGTQIHAKAEHYILDPKSPLPAELVEYDQEFLRLRELGKRVKVEEEWAFDAKWNPVDWKAKDAWVRMKIDVHYLLRSVLNIVDHKTGKVYEDNRSQLSLYALGGMKKLPKAKAVGAELWHLDVPGGCTLMKAFTKDEEQAMQDSWFAAVQPLLTDTVFAPRPGWYCAGCPYSKRRKGPCDY